jgi:hypothetical protein
MLRVFAIILTSISLICTPIWLWIMAKYGEEFTSSFTRDKELEAPMAAFGWLSTASCLFALVVWVIHGIAEYRTPIPKLSDSLSSLETTLVETETAIGRLKHEAAKTEESVTKYEKLSTTTASELASLQSALALAKKNQSDIRTILIGSHWSDRLWSFILGVCSSLIARCLWKVVHRHRKTTPTPS